MSKIERYKDYSPNEINENKDSELNWYYEIRQVISSHEQEWIAIDPWNDRDDGLFDYFDWESVDNLMIGTDEDFQNTDLYVRYMEFLKNHRNSSQYKLYKIITEEVPQKEIDIHLSKMKYNL